MASVTRHHWPLRRVVRFDLGGWDWQIKLPLYYPLAMLSLATVAWGTPPVYRRWRRPRPGHCHRCGYDLRGSPAGSACPECGGIRLTGCDGAA